MNEKHLLTLDNDFVNYCKLNGITDIVGFAKQVFNDGFMKHKYPSSPIVKNVPVEKTVTKNKEEKNDLYSE